MSEIIKVSYTGKVKDTGQVFDTTYEDIAKEHGIYTDKFVYGPVPVILGTGSIIKGLEEELSKMKVGESKTITVKPEKGFGERDPKLLKLVPMKVFKDSGFEPRPGLVVSLEDGLKGTIVSVSGGRVQIDFNHELAGKTLEYEVKLEARAETDEERMQMIAEMVFPKHKLKLRKEEDEITVEIPEEASKLKELEVRKKTLIELLKNYAGAKKVKVVEEY